jgi:hypothetical protein
MLISKVISLEKVKDPTKIKKNQFQKLVSLKVIPLKQNPIDLTILWL